MPSLSEPAGKALRAPAELQQELERVLASPEFAQSVRMQRFLRFIVERTIEGEIDCLKESVIGVQVFDRKIGYDPKIDSIVRVEARRLRTKLDEYQRQSGVVDPVWIVLPKGGYVPDFVWREEPRAPDTVVETMPVAAPRRIARRYALLAGIALTMCVTAAWLVIPNRQSSMQIQGRPFTTWPGYEVTPSFSPDGETIAFASRAIYLQRVGSDQAVRLTHSDQPESEPVWSPDGKQISFFRQESLGVLGIYIMPVAGGSEQKVGEITSTVASGRMARSPDGRFIVTSDRTSRGALGLLLISVYTGVRQWVTQSTVNDSCPRYSPDGASLAFVRTMANGVEDIYLMPMRMGPDGKAVTRSPFRLTFENRPINGQTWSADGRSIIFASQRIGSRWALWRVSVSGGKPVRINGTEQQALQPAIALTGSRMAYVSQFTNMAIWRAPVDGNGPPRPLIASTQYDTDPQYSPDGRRIAFRSTRSGSNAIWVADADGAVAVQVADLNGPLIGAPRWSPDGGLLAFDARAGEQSVIRVAYADGAAPSRRLPSVQGSNDMLPSWSHDGRFLYFASNRSGKWELWKQPASGGAAVQVTPAGGFNAFETVDGKYVYYSKNPKIPGVWRLPGEQLVLPSSSASRFGWALGRHGIYFMDAAQNEDGPADIRYFDIETRGTRLIGRTTAKPSLGRTCITISPHERWLAWAHVDGAGSGIILVEGFQ